MVVYSSKVYLSTPNQDGKKVDFTSVPILKEIREYLQIFNDKQTTKQLKIGRVDEGYLTFIMYTTLDSNSLYLNGRDFVAFSNVLRDHGWLKYSSTDNLLTADTFIRMDMSVEEFNDLPLLPEECNYVWTNDFNKLMTDEEAVDLLKSLFILAKDEGDKKYLTSKASKQKYQNCLYRVKEAIFEAFN